MLRAVEGERQHQHVLEEVRHGAQTPAMGHAVGLQGDHDVGDDAAQADRRPQYQELASRRCHSTSTGLFLAVLRRSTTLPNSTGS